LIKALSWGIVDNGDALVKFVEKKLVNYIDILIIKIDLLLPLLFDSIVDKAPRVKPFLR